jgi:hypothetical protein
MIQSLRIGSLVVAIASLVACNSSGEGAASNASPSAKAQPGAPGAAGQGAKVPELVEMKNDKRHFTFKVPKDTKADPSGDSYSWDTMQIMVEPTMEPVAKAEDLMKVVVGSLKDGAKIDSKTEGDVLVSIWQQPQGPMQIVCGQVGKSVAVRASYEPSHKDIALAICKSLRIEK